MGYQQQIYTILNGIAFKFLISYINKIGQIIFITEAINVNIILSFYLADIFFRNRKFNFFINKIINHFLSTFFILSGCIFSGFRCLIWHQRKHLLSLFLMLIKPFTEFFNLLGNIMYVLPVNGL